MRSQSPINARLSPSFGGSWIKPVSTILLCSALSVSSGCATSSSSTIRQSNLSSPCQKPLRPDTDDAVTIATVFYPEALDRFGECAKKVEQSNVAP